MRRNILNICIFVFFFSSFMLISDGRYGGDGLENYLTAESMFLDHDLVIHDRPFAVKEMSYEARGYTDSKGRYYSTYGIGVPLLLLPLYIIGHLISRGLTFIPHDYVTQFTVSLFNPLVISVTILVLFRFLLQLGFNSRCSFLTVLCYGFCTMSLIYARSGFSEPLAALLVISSLLFIYEYEKKGVLRYLLFAGTAIGYAMLAKKNSYLYAPLFLLYLIYKAAKSGKAGASIKMFLAGLVPVIVSVLIQLYIRLLTGPLAHTAASGGLGDLLHEGTTYGGNFLKALYYYLFSSGKGYFFYNIILILSLFGIRPFTAKNKNISIYLISCIVAPLLFYSYRFMRGSLFSWGPRYMYPTIPLMCVFLAQFIKDAKTLPKKISMVFLAIVSFAVQVPSLFASFTKYIYFVKEKLGIEEYLINFMPELSPINGAWHLFISAIHRTSMGTSIYFRYNPDLVFLQPVIKSLEGYDIWDIWWVNALHLSGKLLPFVYCAVISLIAVMLVSLVKINHLIKKKNDNSAFKKI